MTKNFIQIKFLYVEEYSSRKKALHVVTDEQGSVWIPDWAFIAETQVGATIDPDGMTRFEETENLFVKEEIFNRLNLTRWNAAGAAISTDYSPTIDYRYNETDCEWSEK